MSTATISKRPYVSRKSIIPSQILGMSLIIFTEIMMFAAFLSAYFVSRASAFSWPPADQPRLPVAETAINTVILLISAWTMYKCISEFQKTNSWSNQSHRWMKFTAALGTLFVIGQGREWIRLINFGLTASSSLYGGHFYTIVGAHALHVIAAVTAAIWLYFRKPEYNGIRAFSFFWYFVVGLWPVLYTLVYLV